MADHISVNGYRDGIYPGIPAASNPLYNSRGSPAGPQGCGGWTLTPLRVQMGGVAARNISSSRNASRAQGQTSLESGPAVRPFQSNPVVRLPPSPTRPILERRNASPTEEFLSANYFTETSPDIVPMPTTGFTALDGPMPEQPKQSKLKPRNTLASISKDDGLNVINSAEPGDFFFCKGSKFDLPPPQIPVETRTESQFAAFASHGVSSTESGKKRSVECIYKKVRQLNKSKGSYHNEGIT